ncbi:hypothetical protein EDB19DRAFT_494886 [Suillus lakei]|nr:hypothetical protein EDB19DRAFT_1175579 [Suillus lakei]KAG1721805.1 hypothetical protein EDB19DRAFT_494886 [Suillus lakei]
MEHVRDGRMSTRNEPRFIFNRWQRVLVPRDDPAMLDFICACETYKHTGLVVYPSPEAPCYRITSVYTPKSKRRRGYGHDAPVV